MRKLFRFHLSTALVAMIIAGALLPANVLPKLTPYMDIWAVARGRFNVVNESRGWPFVFSETHYYIEDKAPDELAENFKNLPGDKLTIIPKGINDFNDIPLESFNVCPLALNVLVFLMIHVPAVTIIEILLRSRNPLSATLSKSAIRNPQSEIECAGGATSPPAHS